MSVFAEFPDRRLRLNYRANREHNDGTLFQQGLELVTAPRKTYCLLATEEPLNHIGLNDGSFQDAGILPA